MTPKDRNLVLTKSQAACLIALQHGKESKAEIAIMTKLDLLKTNAALHALTGLGLAEQDRTTAWHVTARGKACVFETVPDRRCRNSSVPSPGARRLLEVLTRPMRGRDIADKLRVTYIAVRQLAEEIQLGRVFAVEIF
jgi:predicted transcriptional regulator